MKDMNRKVLILRGIPGSGKSTYAKLLVDEDWVRVNKDDLRSMMNGYKINKENEHLIHVTQEVVIKTMMSFGRNIVIDNTHAKRKYMNDVIALVQKQAEAVGWNYTIETKVFEIDTEEAIRRDSLRPSPVGEDVIRRMQTQLTDSLQDD